ncbi:heparinase II/III family protein [Nonomuraea gerenzanensis]|uniref:heparinase II/III family protein n=1 Tax=Nonomuraea gerenzanensis TaxID=93944 RepID=UPI001CD9A2C4|nr:heparinase II/III family protein [Nonomuraea gerenzanensis]UBU10196.1 heparinase II/III family protein [Nonomuraea gerenzanensis]
MSFGPGWPSVRRRAATRPWAGAVVAALRDGFARWHGTPVPGPERESAWTHHYFCDADGAALRYDRACPERHVCTGCGKVYAGEPWDGAWRAKTHDALAAQAQRAALLLHLAPDPRPAAELDQDPRPAAGRDPDPRPAAGRDPDPRPAAGRDRDLRPAAGRDLGLRQAAGLDPGLRPDAELDRILSAYARDYLAYTPHGQAAGTGRVQPQSLDEAVWAVGLLRAARWAGDALAPRTRQAVDGMAAAVADLLRPQVGAVHNIHCWLLAALAECAVRLGDADLLAWCRDGEHGAEAQVRHGFHPEGLWYEINPHYHYYALAALLSYVEATGPSGLSEDSAARLSRAIAAPPLLAYADGRLPAYGDGWPDCFTGDFAPQAEAAWTLLPTARPDLTPYYRHPRPAPLRLWYGAQLPEHTAPLTHRPSVAALVFGPDDLPGEPAQVSGQPGVDGAGVAGAPHPGSDGARAPSPGSSGATGSFLWRGPGIALLRSPAVRLVLRAGPDAGWHDHRDKLAVDVQTVTGWSSLDLGTSGYGADFTAWMRSPAAHNIVTVGARPQPAHTGRILDWSPRHVTAESAWDGHVLRRTITVHDHGWTDVLTVTLAHPDEIEWAFHGDGTFTVTGPADDQARTPDDTAADQARTPDDTATTSQHAWLTALRTLPTPADRHLHGTWAFPGAPHLTLTIPQGFTARTATAPGNPNGRPLGLLLVHGHATTARFRATFTGPPAPTHSSTSRVSTT